MNTYRLVISSPDGHVWNGDVVMLSLRGAMGDLAIMAGHIPLMTSVKPCDCKIELADGTVKIGHINGGLLTVSSDGVTLLSGSFTWQTENE